MTTSFRQKAAPKGASIEVDAASDAIKEADAAPIADKGFSKAAAAAAARAAARKAKAVAETPVSDIIEPAKAASSAADKEAKFAAAAKTMEAEYATEKDLRTKAKELSTSAVKELNTSTAIRHIHNRTMASNASDVETELKVGAASDEATTSAAKVSFPSS